MNKQRKALLTHQIFRLAKLYCSRPVSPDNTEWHNRIGNLQAALIREKHGKTSKDVYKTAISNNIPKYIK